MKYIPLLLLLSSCMSQFAALRSTPDAPLNELRMEVADLRHAVHSTEMEVKLVEDRLDTTERDSPRSQELTELRKKVAYLEKQLEKVTGELKTLTHHTSQTVAALESHKAHAAAVDSKLDEVAKLRKVLTQLAQRQAVSQQSKVYLVQPGDTLAKIAGRHGVSVEALRKANGLSTDTDKIVVGQKLIIPQ